MFPDYLFLMTMIIHLKVKVSERYNLESRGSTLTLELNEFRNGSTVKKTISKSIQYSVRNHHFLLRSPKLYKGVNK